MNAKRIVQLENAIKKGERSTKQFLNKSGYKEIAEIIPYLSSSARNKLINNFKHYLDPRVLVYLQDELKEIIFAGMNHVDICRIVAKLGVNDAVSILDILEDNQRSMILEHISGKKYSAFARMISYQEETAGRLMKQNILCFDPDWTVEQSLSYIKQSKYSEYISELIVVDHTKKVLGTIHVFSLLTNSSQMLLKNVMNKSPICVNVTVDQEEVSLLFRQHSLLSAPVIDENGRFIGVITADDMLHVVEEETEEDFMHVRGIMHNNFYMPVIATSLVRVRWLLVPALCSFITTGVLSLFKHTLENKIILSVLMPIVGIMGGNYGLQVATVIVRSLATKELISFNYLRTIWKEVIVSIITTIVIALLICIISYLRHSDWLVSICLFAAVAFNMIWGGVVGVLFPLLLKRWDIDPALAVGPILSTTADILGYVVFLQLARWLIE